MPNVTTQELIEFFRTTKERAIIPYKNSEMIAAVKQSSFKQDIDSLEQLLNEMTDAYIRVNPDKPRETMIRNVQETFVTLAYLADHDPSFEEWKSIGPIDAYVHECDYERVMNLVKKIFGCQKINLMRDVFQYEDQK